MKIAIFLLALVGLATATQVAETYADRSLSSTAVNVIENMRDQMPCGFPGVGIPPLAPLKIPHKEVNIDTEALQLQGVVENFRLNGMDDFDIDEMKINAVTSKVNFLFTFRNVNVDTEYDLRLLLKKAGFTINLVGSGPAKFAVKNISVKGVVKYSLGLLTGKLKLKTLEIRTHIGEVESDIEGIMGEGDINEKLNEYLAEIVEAAVNDNEDLITETIESLAVPKVNSALGDMSLADMIAAVGGNSDEKDKCIPPTY
ncbi:uncharacterized protein LOC126753191 [Bactrocera neohumeralis]|uniref:uncharacterized protein LOC120769113 n=1 Tax=Bactrocera tryoni TaxID=59916 RepID=UPI001A970344|nr:uncharacterized protein LOC120769113 [Bactrocera tryoni]XP_050320386.1 uncharacterized protein LOC126753191 [Bactrocera neohumeralis]